MQYKIIMLKKAINLFYKLAVDYPDWIPQEHKEELEKIEKIEKDPRLVDFRIDIGNRLDIPTSNEIDLKAQIISVLISAKNKLNNILYGTKLNSSNERNKIQDEIENIIKIIDDFLSKANNADYFIKALRDNSIQIDNVKRTLSKSYNNIILKYIRITTTYNALFTNTSSFSAPMFEELRGHKSWVNRVKEKKIDSGLQFVFSTKHFDILGMASRSEWDSCQDLRPGSFWLGKEFNLDVLGSCVSKNVGIIYITDGSDFEGRGEKMIYRSSVWIVKNMDTNSDVLFVQKVYPDRSTVVLEGFKKILEEKLGMDVKIDKAELFAYVERYKYKPSDDSDLPDVSDDHICNECDKELQDNEILTDDDGLIYCQSCYIETFGRCYNCNKEVPLEMVQTVDQDMYCPVCYSKTFSICSECDKEIPVDEAKISNDGLAYCEDCYEE